MPPPIAPAVTETATSLALAALMPHYCSALASSEYRGGDIRWESATLDTGASIIHVFDHQRGRVVRHIQQLDIGWAIYTGVEGGCELLEQDVDLARLILRATAMLAMDAPEQATLH